MTAIEIARKFAEHKQIKDAQRAYTLVLNQKELEPKVELEAASYLFFSKGDYKIAYTSFVALYNRGLFQNELMRLMEQAFYLPNVERLRRRYADNCQRLAQYPYLFQKEFLPFEDLPICFFPFDDEGYVPFDRAGNRFGEYVSFSFPVIDQYFFQNLENPILAKDVYSQYQLEYLNDNVRKSEWVGRENHIYLHYTDWAVFCAHLQCLDLGKLLKDEKLVFLIGDEISQYPIDFKARFGIDYSRYPLKPVEIREVTRMIWHTQLAFHNGGDFFNEIFHEHPNLLIYDSVMQYSIQKAIVDYKANWKKQQQYDTEEKRQLARISHPTEKDFLVAMYMEMARERGTLDWASRIVPALFFQPHFGLMHASLSLSKDGRFCTVDSDQNRAAQSMPVFRQFKYIKTFTPIRRPTTSYGASLRFMITQARDAEEPGIMMDALTDRIVNRNYLVDWQDPRYVDSVLVRFEDSKLNPKATFTALAAFLDIPYTQSMTYCSSPDKEWNEYVRENGFDPAAVYRTYDEFANDDERAYLEYFLRDAYQAYGYDFHYYGGEPVDQAWAYDKIEHFTQLDALIEETLERFARYNLTKEKKEPENIDQQVADFLLSRRKERKQNQRQVADILLRDLCFVNKQGQWLRMMKKLELDPALLEQPLYH